MTPISGAPRTTMSWMAVAACSSVCSRTIASWWGKRVWSITSTAGAVGGGDDGAADGAGPVWDWMDAQDIGPGV